MLMLNVSRANRTTLFQLSEQSQAMQAAIKMGTLKLALFVSLPSFGIFEETPCEGALQSAVPTSEPRLAWASPTETPLEVLTAQYLAELGGRFPHYSVDGFVSRLELVSVGRPSRGVLNGSQRPGEQRQVLRLFYEDSLSQFETNSEDMSLDGLTGLPNPSVAMRRLLEDIVEKNVIPGRYSHLVRLDIGDLGYFNSISMETGDLYLKRVAREILYQFQFRNKSSTAPPIIYRSMGDEFAVLSGLPELELMAALEDISEAVLTDPHLNTVIKNEIDKLKKSRPKTAAIQQSVADLERLEPSVSIGVCQIKPEVSLESHMACANDLMTSAKADYKIKRGVLLDRRKLTHSHVRAQFQNSQGDGAHIELIRPQILPPGIP